MTDDEIKKVIEQIEEALAIFVMHEGGQLSAQQVGVKSMLTALRAQMLNEQRRIRETAR